MKDDKKIVTIQLPNDLYLELANKAHNKMLTLSAYIRLLIVSAYNKENEK